MDLSFRVLQEFFDFMTGGEEIGHGVARHVFDHPNNPDLVIKVENTARSFQNIKEWEFWNDFQHCKDVARWLAPCHDISSNGIFLIMSKTRPLLPKEIPDKVPDFLTDHKALNFGILNKKLVCHDYGLTVRSAETGLRKWRGNKK